MITLLVTESYQCSANYIDFSQCTISEGKKTRSVGILISSTVTNATIQQLLNRFYMPIITDKMTGIGLKCLTAAEQSKIYTYTIMKVRQLVDYMY